MGVNIRLLLVPLSPTSAFWAPVHLTLLLLTWLSGPRRLIFVDELDEFPTLAFLHVRSVGAVFPRSVPQPESERSRKEGKRCGRLKVAPTYRNKSSLTFTFCLSQINYNFMRLNLYTVKKYQEIKDDGRHKRSHYSDTLITHVSGS